VLKKKMQREGIFREIKRRRHEKPSRGVFGKARRPSAGPEAGSQEAQKRPASFPRPRPRSEPVRSFRAGRSKALGCVSLMLR
jgi:hypothetical protein